MNSPSGSQLVATTAIIMPRLTVNNLQTEITDQYIAGATIEELRASILADYGTRVSQRTLERRLHAWGVSKNVQLSPETRGLLKLRIAFHFHRNLNDEEIQWALIHEGFENLPLRTLARLRLSMQLIRRTTLRGREEAQEELRKQVQTELDKGNIENYGRGALHVHFRKIGMSVAR
jgi:hypothetical protein